MNIAGFEDLNGTNDPRRRRSDDGFTLVEILIAIVLVGVLSAVVVVGISSLTNKAGAAGCSTSMDAARTGSAVYLTQASVYPSTLKQMTTLVPPALTFPSGVTLNSAASGSRAAGTIATGPGWALTMLPGFGAGAPTFGCGDIPPSPPCPGTFTDWAGEYYANTTLSGTPTLCRNDANVNFAWGAASPGGNVPEDQFSVRWTRVVSAPAGTYTITVGSDDGMRIFIDGVMVIDWWTDHLFATRDETIALTSGAHTVIVEYYDRQGNAQISLPAV